MRKTLFVKDPGRRTKAYEGPKPTCRGPLNDFNISEMEHPCNYYESANKDNPQLMQDYCEMCDQKECRGGPVVKGPASGAGLRAGTRPASMVINSNLLRVRSGLWWAERFPFLRSSNAREKGDDARKAAIILALAIERRSPATISADLRTASKGEGSDYTIIG
ncbi:unnamed protein product [Spodoptera exigua]|nr:unnamed protein product [Spodoptera exigua]